MLAYLRILYGALIKRSSDAIVLLMIELGNDMTPRDMRTMADYFRQLADYFERYAQDKEPVP